MAFVWNPMGGGAFAYSALTIINSVSKLRPTSSIVLIRDMYYTIVALSDRTMEARSKNAGLSDATWVNLCVIVPGSVLLFGVCIRLNLLIIERLCCLSAVCENVIGFGYYRRFDRAFETASIFLLYSENCGVKLAITLSNIYYIRTLSEWFHRRKIWPFCTMAWTQITLTIVSKRFMIEIEINNRRSIVW